VVDVVVVVVWGGREWGGGECGGGRKGREKEEKRLPTREER